MARAVFGSHPAFTPGLPTHLDLQPSVEAALTCTLWKGEASGARFLSVPTGTCLGRPGSSV